jgi:hypothetical protein
MRIIPVAEPLKVAVELLNFLAKEGRFSWLAVVLPHHSVQTKEVTLRRIALGISRAKHLPTRDVDYLVRLRLVDEGEGRLKLTDLGLIGECPT